MSKLDDLETFAPTSELDWRNWLQANHATKIGVWVVYYKKASGKPTVAYTNAVDQALCFGWIDSKQVAIDDEKHKQYFCPRKPTSVWSKVNKQKVENLIATKQMTDAGLNSINIAKANGTWNILDDAEALVVPLEMKQLLATNETAKQNFEKFSRSDKRNILQWITLAKRAETKLARINETVNLAAENKKPKQFTVVKKNVL